MTVKEILQNFYESLAQKNNDWQKNLSENIVFSDASKRLHAEGKQVPRLLTKKGLTVFGS